MSRLTTEVASVVYLASLSLACATSPGESNFTGSSTIADIGSTGGGTSETSVSTNAGEETSDETSTDSDVTGEGTSEGEGIADIPCAYNLVHEQSGLLLTVAPDTPSLAIQPLAAGASFTCMRIEFDLQTLANLDELADEFETCPEYQAIASIFGSGPKGDVLATAFFHHSDAEQASCTPGEARAEVGNYLDYTADVAGPWPPGGLWHITLEARPFVTRMSIAEDGVMAGPRLEASLQGAGLDDSLNPVVRLGQPGVVAGKFFPWYGATYSNLSVWAEVVGP